MKWSHNGKWMVTTDDRGFVKYWQINFNNVHTFQAHSEPIRSSRWDYTRSCDSHVTVFCACNDLYTIQFNYKTLIVVSKSGCYANL